MSFMSLAVEMYTDYIKTLSPPSVHLWNSNNYSLLPTVLVVLLRRQCVYMYRVSWPTGHPFKLAVIIFRSPVRIHLT